MKKLLICLLMGASLMAVSCKKTCECTRYDGGVDVYDMDDLKAEDKSCAEMEQLYYGRLYVMCERTF